jgi:hypothetical protein
VEVRDYIQARLVHEVHTSERQSFRGCRRRWHWVFQEFYYPQTTAKPLEFGVAFHAAMEVLYEPTTWKWDREVVLGAAIKEFVDQCEGQKKKFLASSNAIDFTNEEVETDYKDRVELGVGMLKYYAKDVAPKYDAHMTPIRVEVEFIVPIQNPDNGEYLWCTCLRCQKTQIEFWAANGVTDHMLYEDGGTWHYQLKGQEPWERQSWQGLPVCLAGRIDLLAEDEHGGYWIVDWKTAARLARGDVSGQDKDEFLELNDQIGSYVMALRRKLGLNVRGFIYVELKKAFPEPPTRNKVVRLGRSFSVNQNQAVDYDSYLKTVKEEDTAAYEAGLYDEHLAWLKEGGQNFHGRYQITKTDEELEELERLLYAEASDMVDPGLRIYPSAGRFNCGFCAFRQPCLERNRQGDYQYLLDTMFDRREKHYWVKELSTDSQGGE